MTSGSLLNCYMRAVILDHFFPFKIVGDLQHEILCEESAKKKKHSLVTILVTK